MDEGVSVGVEVGMSVGVKVGVKVGVAAETVGEKVGGAVIVGVGATGETFAHAAKIKTNTKLNLVRDLSNSFSLS